MEHVYRSLPQYGGMNTRFGSILSGNPNINVFRGSPRGGTTGTVSKYFQDPTQLGGRKSRRRMHGRGDEHTMDSFLSAKALNFRPYILDPNY